MATPERDTVYTTDSTVRPTYTRESSATGWFVGIIVALALLAIGYLVFSANSGPATTSVDVNNTRAIETPMAPATETTPMVEAPAAPVDVAPVETAPVEAAPVAPADTAPAVEAPAPAVEPAQ